MNAQDTQRFLSLSLALTGERDREALLSRILDTAMEVSDCDAGTLYLLEEEELRFCRMVTLSQGTRQGGHDAPITLPPVPLEEKYVCSWVALRGETINVPDVRTDTHFDFTGSLRYDAMTGYLTKSMLVVPLRNDRDEILGVMQLINAMDGAGRVVPFDPEVELLVSAIASQAAISITNMQYSEQITSLLDSLVGALTTAIDERSPYNANHTRNMALVGEAFLDYMDRVDHPRRFDEDTRRAFLMAIRLHDVGKLAVPPEVMDKENRLGSLLPGVLERFRTIGLLDRIAHLEGAIDEAEYARRREALEAARALVTDSDRAGFLPDEKLAEITALSERTYLDENGKTCPWLTPEETHCLSVRKGTLTEEERSVMQGHVTVTERILSQVTFPKLYAQVPGWASAHHELLNGHGYPRHLTGESIPSEVRLITVLDVFDALTAQDRPYKPAMPVEKALGILHSMAEDGEMDGDWLAAFEESRAWEVLPRLRK